MITSITKQASINSDKHVNKIYHHQDAQKHVPKYPSLKSPKSKPPLLSFDHNFSINIRNDGGEIFRELITSNIINDYIQIKFEETDGSLIQQILDFKNRL
ncbi:hypothetical protein DERP_010920 [Dermatophagoides pteronyssinus]|uniref:Out at first protein BRICHOS-like domain-containing protein n=1 Tax=Dermatophagoides pteronyssinus TaxID=6956 RepID=A0ABQ8JUW9_DERPT|nr:hypothetical protein DERP_010920 [Dermatophagoides pteronyssinus]